MMTSPLVRRFGDPDAMVDSLASHVVVDLSNALRGRGTASLVVSGGRTPAPLFERLAHTDLDWAAVTVTLADERWVPPDDPASNESLVRSTLLTGNADTADFIALYTGDATPEAGETEANDRLSRLARPFDVVLLGMGDDGHTASLFPDAPTLSAALTTDRDCIAARPASQPQPRMTLSLTRLLRSRSICVMVTGDTKASVLDNALMPGPVEALPVRAVLSQSQTPVEVYWSP